GAGRRHQRRRRRVGSRSVRPAIVPHGTSARLVNSRFRGSKVPRFRGSGVPGFRGSEVLKEFAMKRIALRGMLLVGVLVAGFPAWGDDPVLRERAQAALRKA